MRAYAVLDKDDNVVEVCGSRLAVYPLVPEALDVVEYEARASEHRVAIVTITPEPAESAGEKPKCTGCEYADGDTNNPYYGGNQPCGVCSRLYRDGSSTDRYTVKHSVGKAES